MALTLYFHPLASYCHKPLIALYENAIAFTPELVNLGDPAARDNFRKVWPMAKFPVLRDDSRNQVIPESTSIIEYLERHYPGPVRLIPKDDEDLAARVRALDPARTVVVRADPSAALDAAAAASGTICVAGSIFLAGAIRERLVRGRSRRNAVISSGNPEAF